MKKLGRTSPKPKDTFTLTLTNKKQNSDPNLSKNVFGFRVYGDNIGECIKFTKIIEQVAPSLGLDLIRIYRPHFAPIYYFQASNQLHELEGEVLAFQVCGRYREWKKGRFTFLGHEDTDVILTSVSQDGGVGKAILALEFNDAIPAGNNAWQRFPRIAHSGQHKVPFLYCIPVCDAEVKDGKIKSIRHPNIIVLLGQLVLMARFGIPSFTIYGDSPWYLYALERNLVTKEVVGVHDEDRVGKFALLEALLAVQSKLKRRKKQLIVWLTKQRKKIFKECMVDMLAQTSHFVQTDFSLLSKHPLLDIKNYEQVIKVFWQRLNEDKKIPQKYRFYEWGIDLLKKESASFSKATSTDSLFKDELNPRLRVLSSGSKKDLRDFSKRWGINIPEDTSKADIKRILTEGEESWKHPLSYKPPANEAAFIFQPRIFANLLAESYEKLDPKIIEHCRKARPPILFVPLAGYVEDSGGVIAFSRPDKGFVSLMSTLFRQSSTFCERVLLMYHQEIPRGWREELKRAIREEKGHKIERAPNNLWREVARFATIVIIDHLQEGFIL